jgi:beta-N-acetylhexosaminidase
MTPPPPRAVIFGCAGLRLTPQERALFAQAQPWGVILFARNIETPDQLTALTAELRDAVARDIPVLIDQEGGRVQRMRRPYWRDWSPALEQCMRARDPARAMYLRGRLIASELLACGINVNCAPLADIANDHTHPVLHNRCYGTALAQVVTNAKAMAQGLMAGGVLPVLKHIPGHGRAKADSHLDLPVIDDSVANLVQSDFAAFQALADLPLGMTAHLLFSQIDPVLPATLSPHMIQLIRTEIGFQGLLMTDDISMQALTGTIGARACAALAAGCDLVLHCNGDLREMSELAEVCPPLAGETRIRAQTARAKRRAPDTCDLEALDAEYADLTA